MYNIDCTTSYRPIYRLSCSLNFEIEIKQLSKLSYACVSFLESILAFPLYLHWPNSLIYSKNKPSFRNVKTLHLSFEEFQKEECKFKSERELDLITSFSPNPSELRLEKVVHEALMNKLVLCGDTCILLKLNSLILAGCDKLGGGSPVLIKSALPQLQHLSLLETSVSEDDLEFLCLTCNGPEKRLPNLTSLGITIPNDIPTKTACTKLFLLPWLNLEKLFFDYQWHRCTVKKVPAPNREGGRYSTTPFP